MRHDLVTMLARIKKALAMETVRERVHQDFALIIDSFGFNEGFSLVETFFLRLERTTDLLATELKINLDLTNAFAYTGSLDYHLRTGLNTRAEIICKQVAPYFKGVDGRVIDYGCGDGSVAVRLLEREVVKEIVGYDVSTYTGADKGITIKKLETIEVPEPAGSFAAGLMTNVLHHEVKNGLILSDLSRLIKPSGKLVVIETCPEKDTLEDFEVTFLNDYIYNRLFHPKDDLPVPGTFETARGWVKRFEASGFEVRDIVELGYDQPLIRDWHVLYELQRFNYNPL